MSAPVYISESEQTSVARLLEEWDNPMFKIDATVSVSLLV